MKTFVPAIYLFTISLFIYGSAKGQVLNPASPALGFQVFVQNGMTIRSGNVAGAVAVGADLALQGNSTIAMNSSGAYPLGAGNNNNYGLVVNGRVVFGGGNTTYVNRGYLKLGNATGAKIYDKDQNNANTNLRITGGSFNSNPQIQLQRMQSAVSVTEPSDINFTNAFLQMGQFANSINNLLPGN